MWYAKLNKLSVTKHRRSSKTIYQHQQNGGLVKMATMFVRHTVSDYGNWKRAYDEFASVRKENGVTVASVHRDASDPNTIIVTHQFKDVDAAKAFAASEDLKSAMAKAGVAGPPEIWFSEDVERTPY
jgi:quinol monooxygenase YgiN